MYEYALYENPVTPNPDDRVALISNQKTYSLDDIFRVMTNRGSTVTIAEARSVFEETNYAVEQLLTEGGGNIVTPLFKISVRIVGVFDGDKDNFDPSRHQVKIRLSPGMRLREMETKIKVRKIAAELPQPILQHIFDHASESQDEVITAGGAMSITGLLLKYDEADPKQGIFFITSSNKEIRVTSKPIKNKPGELIFMVPEGLEKGSYLIELRATINNGKEIRKGTFNENLTVA